MDLGIIFDRFWMLLCSSICRMPKPPVTKRNNGKPQEHADNCRNMQTSNANKKQIAKTPIDNLQAAECKQLHHADLQIRGRRCSRRMAHSDPPPPSRRAGFQGVSDLHSDVCRLLTSDGPRPIRRPPQKLPGKSPLPAPSDPKCLIFG